MTLKNKNNYSAFFNALLTITMLGNAFNDELEKATSSIIDFIYKAYEVDEKDADFSKKLISDDLTIVSTTLDAEAFANNEGEKEYPDIANFLYLKCEILNRLGMIYTKLNNSYYKSSFNYNHLRSYYAENRFNELQEASVLGYIDINRTTAIMLALGIGVKQNRESAIYRLKQCALWGDIASLYLLKVLYQEEKEAQIYKDLTLLSSYFLEGRTIIPKKDEDKYLKEAKELFAIISSVRQDIVLSLNITNIDYSFVEVLLLDKLDYYQKMAFINQYKEGTWKEISNSSNDPNKRLGFKVKGDK